VVLEYCTEAAMKHQKILEKLKFMSPNNVPMILENPLLKLKTIAKARERFISFKFEDGGILGANASKDDFTMIRQAWALISRNVGDIQDKAITGAFAAYVSYMYRVHILGCDEENAKHGNRYDTAFRNYMAAEYLMSSAKQSFTRANLFEGVAPYNKTCKRIVKAWVRLLSCSGPFPGKCVGARSVRCSKKKRNVTI
jgi:hypothetical protein